MITQIKLANLKILRNKNRNKELGDVRTSNRTTINYIISNTLKQKTEIGKQTKKERAEKQHTKIKI